MEEVRSQYRVDPDRRIGVIDSTIRKAEYTVGARLTVDDRVLLAQSSASLGCRELFLNNIHTSGDLFATAVRIKTETSLLLNVQTYLDSDWRSGLDSARACGADVSEIEARTSSAGLTRVGFDPVRSKRELVSALSYGGDKGSTMSLGLMDFGRADISYLEDLVGTGLENGASKLDLYDSFGCVAPTAMYALVSRLRLVWGGALPIIIHVHDSCGVAVASTLAGVAAGATDVDCAAYGLPPNIPLASLEATVIALEALMGVDTGIDKRKLVQHCELVQRVVGVPIPVFGPVVGAHRYVATAGRSDRDEEPETYADFRLFKAETVGADFVVVWDEASMTNRNVAAKASALGSQMDEQLADRISAALLARVRAVSRYPHWLTDAEVEDVIRQHLRA